LGDCGTTAEIEYSALPTQSLATEDDAILGTRPDEQVAKLLGRTKVAVRTRRSELGKAAWIGERRPPRWTEKEIQLLGKVPDAEAAKILGKSLNSVKLKRQRLGIARQ
jgi:hypothetical protein